MVINAAFYGARNPFHIYMCRLPNVPRRHFDVILTLLCLSSNSACTVSCDFCHCQILFISFYASFFFLDFNFYPLFHHHRVPWLYIYITPELKTTPTYRMLKILGSPNGSLALEYKNTLLQIRGDWLGIWANGQMHSCVWIQEFGGFGLFGNMCLKKYVEIYVDKKVCKNMCNII